MSNIREVYRAGWLKKITSNDRKKSFKNPHVEKVWMVFCVHDDRFPFLEQYKSRATSSGHLPLFAYPLTECFHISTSIRPTLEQEHEFVVTLRQDVVKFSSHRREVAVEWVSILRGQLRQLHVLGAASNVYTRVARTPAHPSHVPPTPTNTVQPPPSLLTGQRDPTSPLPAPPPQQQQQQQNNNNDTADCTALNSNVSGDLTDCYIAENAYSVSPVSSSRTAVLTDTPSVAAASAVRTTVAVEVQNQARLGTAAVSCVRARDPPSTNDRNARPAANTGDVVVSSLSNKHNKTTTTTNVLQNSQSQPGSHVTVISVGDCVQLGQSHLPPSSSSISSSLAAAAVVASAVDSGIHTPSLPVLSLDGVVGRRRSDHVTAGSRASRSHHHEQQQLSADRSLSAVVVSSHSSVQRSHSLTPQHQRPTLTRLAPPSFHRQTSDCSLDSRHVTRSGTHQQRHQTGGGVVPPSASQQTVAVSAAATSDRRAGSSVTGASSSSAMPHQLRTETAVMRGASGSSLSRDQYVAVLKREISFRPGVRITLPLNTVTTALLFSEAFGSLWLCGWKWREQPALSRALHVGDSLVSVCGVAVSTAPQLSRTLKQMHQRAVVELIIRRLPHGMVMLIKRDSESQPLGLECSSGSGEVIKVCGAASNQGLPGRCRAASGGSLCNWYISELDCRPVPLISRGDQLATRLASLTARDVCVVLLPVDLVHVLQRRLKATRHCKQFVLH